ncbi:uncharacterized protein [Amphiura filiformis]|uniref:uncharacterized protein n=1 Tax=Amphiura filiformis TaxID=82378 RepID=UPI003B21485E
MWHFERKQYRRNRIGANVTGGGKQPAENKGLQAVLNALPDEVTEGVVPARGTCETIPQIETLPEDQEIDNVLEYRAGPSTEITRKRMRVVKYDSTEAESQSSQYVDLETKKKKKKKQKNISKKKDEGVTLLEMNREIQEVEKRKLEVQEGILGALLSIDATLKKRLPQETALDLFNQMQTEQ